MWISIWQGGKNKENEREVYIWLRDAGNRETGGQDSRDEMENVSVER